MLAHPERGCPWWLFTGRCATHHRRTSSRFESVLRVEWCRACVETTSTPEAIATRIKLKNGVLVRIRMTAVSGRAAPDPASVGGRGVPTRDRGAGACVGVAGSAVVSTTVTLKLPLALLPAASVAEQLTRVVPSAKVLPTAPRSPAMSPAVPLPTLRRLGIACSRTRVAPAVL